MAVKLLTAFSRLIMSKCCCFQLNSQENKVHLSGTMEMTKVNCEAKFLSVFYIKIRVWFYTVLLQLSAAIRHHGSKGNKKRNQMAKVKLDITVQRNSRARCVA